jgi:hypothetical protein
MRKLSGGSASIVGTGLSAGGQAGAETHPAHVGKGSLASLSVTAHVKRPGV